MAPEAITRTIKAYFAAFGTLDQQAWVNTFAEDAVSHDPVGTDAIVGHQKLGEFFQTITAAFKEVDLTTTDIFIAGNGAAVRWSGRGISKQGRKVHFEGIDVFALNEAGKIQTLNAYWNPAELVAQL